MPYVLNAIRWAKLIGCPCVDTTDGIHKPEGLSDKQALEACLRQISDNLARMTKVVNTLKHVRRIVLTDYLDGVKMLDLERSVMVEPQAEAPDPAAMFPAAALGDKGPQA